MSDDDGTTPESRAMAPQSPPFHCSFCGKSRVEVKKLIAGLRVFICNQCVWLCVDILNEEGFDRESTR